MRLPNDARKVCLALGLSAVLSACIGGGGGDVRQLASAENALRGQVANGPEADYPQVLGEPFTVDGQLFTPADEYSYDSVGYAALAPDLGQGIIAAHKTLPVPSYVELTSLESGKTILARVERRGPMTASRIVALSAPAQALLGVTEGTPIRVRRVNPPEFDRAELRAGRPAPERLETPQSLLAVLKKNLPATGSASLAGPQVPTAEQRASLAPVSMPPSAAKRAPEASKIASASATSVEKSFDKAFTATRKANSAYPLAPVAGVAPPPPATAMVPARTAPTVVARAPEVRSYSLPGTQTVAPKRQTGVSRTEPAPARQIRQTADGKFVVQAAAFTSKANADRLASQIEGFVMPAGRYFRVRTGPYATRGQAEAALAKVRAAGYSDARVFSAG
ncbi:SPOR domain-containing protein [Altererythrobacter sp.]|nr:SPOR domain-containing protein [Altererythrobacter sp.]